MSSSSSASAAYRPPIAPSSFTMFDNDTAYIVDVPLTPALFQGREWEPIRAIYLRNIEFPESMQPVYETMSKIENFIILFLLQISFSEKQTKELMNFLADRKEIVRLDLQECSFSETAQKIILSSIKNTGVKVLTLNFPVAEDVLANNIHNLSSLQEIFLPGNTYSRPLVAQLLTEIPDVAIQGFVKENSNKRPSEYSFQEYEEDRKLYIYDQDDSSTVSDFHTNVEVLSGSILTKLPSKECVQALHFLKNPSHRLEDKLAKVLEVDKEEDRDFLYTAMLENQFTFYPCDSLVDSICEGLKLSEDENFILTVHVIETCGEDISSVDVALKCIADFFKDNQRPIQIHLFEKNCQLLIEDGKLESTTIYGDFSDASEVVRIYQSFDPVYLLTRKS